MYVLNVDWKIGHKNKQNQKIILLISQLKKYNKKMKCQPILRLLRTSNPLFNKLRYSSTNFEIQHIKPVDSKKQAIVLMNTPPKYDVKIQFLKLSKQYVNKSKARLLFAVNPEANSLGEICQIAYDSHFIGIEMKGGFERFLEIFNSATQLGYEQLDQLGLHVNDRLTMFMKTVQYLDTRTHQSVIRALLALLSNYYEYSALSTQSQRYHMIHFLAQRGYAQQSMGIKVSKITINKQELSRVLKAGSSTEILQQFKQHSYMLLSAISLSKLQNMKLYDFSKPIKQLEQAYFQFVENPAILESILQTEHTQLIAMDYLFEKHRHRAYTIVLKILNPWIYENIKINPSLIQLIFDKILLYSTAKDAPFVTQILQQYQKCIICSNYYPGSILRGGGSLIMLCKKYSHKSKPLLYDIFNNYLRLPIHIQTIYCHSSIRKNKLYLINKTLQRLYQLSTFMQIVDGMNVSYEKQLANELQRQTYRICAENPYNVLNFNNYREQRNNVEEDTNTYQSYYYSNIFYCKKKDIAGLSNYYTRVEKELGILKQNVHQDFGNPIDIEYNDAAKLKIILSNMLYNRFFNINVNMFSHFFPKLRKDVVKILGQYKDKDEGEDKDRQKDKDADKIKSKNKYYPGLVQAAYYVYYYAKYNNYDHENCQLKKFIKSNWKELDTKVSYNWSLLKQKQRQIIHKSSVQCLKDPIKLKFDYFLEKCQNLLSVNMQILAHIKKFQPLLAKVTQFLITLKQSKSQAIKSFHAFPNYTEFPFFADYSIFCNNKRFFVLLVTPQQKQKCQSFVKRLRQKNPQDPAPAVKNNVQESQQWVNLLSGLMKQKQQSNVKGPQLSNLKLKQQSNVKSSQFSNLKLMQLTIRYFQEKGTVIFVSNDQQIKVLRLAIQKK